jgi:hypothetical protein
VSKDLKIVICDRCGERFDYIPKTCSKCGEILDARMDPDAKRKILEMLRPPNKLRPVFIAMYLLFCVIFMFATAISVIFGVFIIPQIAALVISYKEKKEKQSIMLHLTFIGYNLLITAGIYILIMSISPRFSNDYAIIFTGCLGLFLVWLIAVIFIETAREKITGLWAVILITMFMTSMIIFLANIR